MDQLLRRALKQKKKAENKNLNISTVSFRLVESSMGLLAAQCDQVREVTKEVRIRGLCSPPYSQAPLHREGIQSLPSSPEAKPNAFLPQSYLVRGVSSLSPALPQLTWRILFTSTVSLSLSLLPPLLALERCFSSGSTLPSLTKSLLSAYSSLLIYLAKEVSCSPSHTSHPALGASFPSQGCPAPTALSALMGDLDLFTAGSSRRGGRSCAWSIRSTSRLPHRYSGNSPK